MPTEQATVIERETMPATQQGQPPAVHTPTDLIAMAVQSGADIDKLERLMDLQDRWEAGQAKKAFFRALSDFQAICPVIHKRKQVSFNTTNYSYAPLADIVEQIREPLNSVGLSYRFEQELGDQIKVTCIISHIDGHSERTSLASAADGSGGKNSIQGIGSTVTYLQRYTLLGGLGITTADTDMDGRISQDVVTEGQAASLKARLQHTGSDVAKFCKALGIANVDAMPAAKYAQADRMLTQKEAAAAKKEAGNADSE